MPNPMNRSQRRREARDARLQNFSGTHVQVHWFEEPKCVHPEASCARCRAPAVPSSAFITIKPWGSKRKRMNAVLLCSNCAPPAIAGTPAIDAIVDEVMQSMFPGIGPQIPDWQVSRATGHA